jgi:O-antigen/teichoic acid export membrane protein
VFSRPRASASAGRDTNKTSLAANAFSLIASRLMVAAMGWVGTLIIVHRLSERDWGRFSFVFAFLATLSIFTGVTSPRVVFRGLEEDDGSLVGTYVLLRLVIGVFAYAVALTFVSVGGYPPIVLSATAVAGLALIVRNFAYGFDVMFQFWRRLPQVALAAALGQAVQLGLIIGLALTHSSLVAFTVPAVASEIVALLWKLHRLPSRPQVRYRLLWNRALELVKYSIPLAIGDAFGIMYYSLDTVMLSKLDTFRSVGVYAVACKFAGVILIVPQAVGATLYPIAIRYWPDEPERFRAVIGQAARLYLVIGAAVTLEFAVFAPKAISLLYGGRYAVGADATRLVVASECIAFFTSLAIMTLVSVNRNGFYPLVALGGLLLNFGLNLWLIPTMSYLGSAWATLVTELLVATTLWIASTRVSSARLVEPRTMAKVAVSVAAAALVAVAVGSVAPWFVAAVIAGGVYLAALAVTRVAGTHGLRSLISFEGHSIPAR